MFDLLINQAEWINRKQLRGHDNRHQIQVNLKGNHVVTSSSLLNISMEREEKNCFDEFLMRSKEFINETFVR